MISALYNLAYYGLLSRLEPETAHNLGLKGLALGCRGPIARLLQARVPPSPRYIMGIEFPNPVGLAAGLDKNGDYLDALAGLGFGFIEVGTVTPRPQPGNASPRLFRLSPVEALINRMGFNNRGVDHLVAQIRRSRFQGVLGVNIGKNFDTPVARAADDYLICLRKVYPYARYVAVNISSPNTLGLRDLQVGDTLDRLLNELKTEQAKLDTRHNRYVPLAVKLAPDLEDETIEAIAHSLLRHNIDGVIATNTTVSRPGVASLPQANEEGGLSGKPLMPQATKVVWKLHQVLGGRLPIIAVGGIMSGNDARAKFNAGACLVQLYTGLIYRGPALIREVAWALQPQP